MTEMAARNFALRDAKGNEIGIFSESSLDKQR
jgi:hypothetical protein